MKKVLAILFSFVALINLNACMTTQEAAARYDNMSAEQLCFDYLSLPDYNFWQADRRASIQRRGLDCSPYAAAAFRRARLLNAIEGTANAISTQTNTSTSTSSGPAYIFSSSYISGINRICVYKFGTSEKIKTMSGIGACPSKY